MELAQILKTLLNHRLAVAVVLVVALAIAIVSGYKVSAGGLERRSLQYGAATQQVLVDSPESALVDLKKDTGPLSVRALVYAQFMRSSAIVDAIAHKVGITRQQITTQGPFAEIGADQNTTQPDISRSNQVAAERDRYRLAFDAQENLPVVTVYAQAPSEEKAMRLTNAAVQSLSDYVDQLQARDALPSRERVVIRPLGPATGGTVDHGARKMMMALIFLVVAGFGCALIVGYAGIRRNLHALDDAVDLDVPARAERPRAAADPIASLTVAMRSDVSPHETAARHGEPIR